MSDEEKRVVKCEPLAKTLCSTLDERTHELANERRAGFFVVVATDFASPVLAETFYGVGYRKKGGDKGLMINHCPFCGVDWRPAHAGIAYDQEDAA